MKDVVEARAPTLHRLLSRSGVALLNTASASARTPEGSFVSTSSGAHAAATSHAGQFACAWERVENSSAREVFMRRTGRRVGPNTLLALNLPALLAENAERRTGACPGALGLMLSQLGPTACVGCPDGPPLSVEPLRLAPLLAMRPSGVIDRGDISPALLRPDPKAPFGVATDPAKLETAFLCAVSRASTVVVDLGETARAEAYRPWLAPDAALVHRRAAIERADRLVAVVLRHIEPRRTIVALTSPFPPLSPEGRVQTPGFFAVTDSRPGLLISPTTRTAGLIANIDILPTLAARLGLSPPRGILITGSTARLVSAPDHVQTACSLQSRIELERQMASGPLLAVIAVLAGVLAVAGSAAALYALAPSCPLRATARMNAGSFARAASGCAALFPTAILMVPTAQTLGVNTPARYWLATLGIWLALCVPAALRPRWALAYALWVTAGYICVQHLLGAVLFAKTGVLGGAPMALSVLNDFPLIGARFHGLSNEVMGILLGAVLTLLCISVKPALSNRLALWALALGVAAFVAAPPLGDNAGGAGAAVFALGSAAELLSGRQIRGKTVLTMALAAGAVVCLLMLADARSDGTTHLGRTVLIVQSNGPTYALGVAARKLALNLRLAVDARALWFYAGLAGLAVLWTSVIPGAARDIVRSRQDIRRLLTSSAIGAAAAFLFNDTGIIPAGFILSGCVLGFTDALGQHVAASVSQAPTQAGPRGS
ncbi:MAG: hypothetical protein ACUVTZ_06845 [Armatimonadota bacterium]